MANLIDPIVGQPHIARDIAQLLVAQVLNADNSPVFADGIPTNLADDSPLVCILPFYMEDKPARQAVVRVTPTTSRAENPIRTASVTVGIRMPVSTDASNSALANVSALGNALALWLKPLGYARGETQLPSGRLIRIFKNVLDPTIGEDVPKRFVANVTFDIFYLDINVP